MIRRRTILSVRAACVGLASVALATGGCRAFRADESPAGVETGPAPTALAGSARGLEVVVWTCDDRGYNGARALRAYEDRPVPVTDADRDAWRRAGFRLVSVPAGDLDALAGASNPITPVQRQRFGSLTRWSTLVRGPAMPAGVPAGASSVGTPAGRGRLIARSWVEPEIAEGGVLETVRTELGVQIETGRRAAAFGTLDEGPTLATIERDGPVLGTLLTWYRSAGDDALVIVPEDPAVEWSLLPDPIAPDAETSADPVPLGPSGEGAGDAASVGVGERPAGAGSIVASRALGPDEPRARTLGEWMLSSPGVPARRGRAPEPPRRVFVVLVARPRDPGVSP